MNCHCRDTLSNEVPNVRQNRYLWVNLNFSKRELQQIYDDQSAISKDVGGFNRITISCEVPYNYEILVAFTNQAIDTTVFWSVCPKSLGINIRYEFGLEGAGRLTLFDDQPTVMHCNCNQSKDTVFSSRALIIQMIKESCTQKELRKVRDTRIPLTKYLPNFNWIRVEKTGIEEFYFKVTVGNSALFEITTAVFAYPTLDVEPLGESSDYY